MIDDHELESLAALYVWERHREADKTAQDADYQDSGPAELSERMRKQINTDTQAIVAFLSWIKKRRKA